ncbi:peptide-methionine (S)-S-oxide reductase MsrA [Planctomycetes bacterium K23_9]|uniref:Peptide methionine sulfoxide reductase MsrA n=1 Tax=Stieleria marina TaxID=1930275 RepID=A0A517P3F3_9BACT|nr:Peptide methionine sulfoxide reductase MsrA [Planctomycetes bacterium K23_9]
MKISQTISYTLPLVALALFAVAQVSADEATTSPAKSDAKPTAQTEKVLTLAGGCFWCTEAVFERMDGVNDVVSGYIGGKNPNPTYKQVCTGLTNHAEAIEIYYDPNKTCLEELLSMFFKTHDPTTLNKQGADEGTQYRSSIFYRDDDEKAAAAAYMKKIASEFRDPIVTQLEPATKFFPAEEYHQDYFRKNPNAGYCRQVVAKKVRKANNVLKKKAKDPC